MDKRAFAYILASKRNGTLYVGVTSSLRQRIHQHREGVVEGFARQYHVKRLVHYEIHDSIEMAIAREKRLKRWRRAWKIALVEERNPEWRDLWTDVCS